MSLRCTEVEACKDSFGGLVPAPYPCLGTDQVERTSAPPSARTMTSRQLRGPSSSETSNVTRVPHGFPVSTTFEVTPDLPSVAASLSPLTRSIAVPLP